MWKADLCWNVILMLADIFLLLRIWKRPGWTAPILIYGFVALMAALLLTVAAGLRLFGTMRFLGMALFWHLPFLLFIQAIRKRRILPFLTAIILLMVYVYAYYVEPHKLEITRYSYKHRLLDGLQRPIVIAQISDIQTDHVGAFERRVIDELARLKPDIVVHTGDYLHTRSRSAYAQQASMLRSLFQGSNWNPSFGSFAVKGDADESDLWTAIFEGQPVQILDNESKIVNLPGVAIQITGLNRSTSRASDPVDLADVMHGARKDLLHVFIGHSPDYVLALREMKHPFLALAGHTHGGQVQLPWIGPLLTLSQLPRRYADYYGPFGPGTLSVSRGIGMERREAPRLRFLCRPEIRLITLVP